MISLSQCMKGGRESGTLNIRIPSNLYERGDSHGG